MDQYVHADNPEVVQYLLEADGDRYLCNYSIACTAISHGSLEVMKYLLANTDIQEFDVLTFLNAMHNGHHQMVKFMLENGAIVGTGGPLLQYYVMVGDLEMVKLIMGRRTIPIVQVFVIYTAAKAGRMDVMKYLVEAGAHIKLN